MNMKKLFKQAQKMQDELQRDLNETSVEASVGGEILKVTMNGNKQLLSVHIDQQALGLEEDDTQMLEDLILSAVNEANRRVDEAIQNKVGSLTPGIPNLF